MGFATKMPERIGRYDIVLQIARGGMATVYLARAEGLGGFDRYVALKLTAEHLRDDPEFAEHLVDEAKLVAHLRHQNVVPVHDVGEHDLGAVFLVMDYVPGDSLGGLLKLARNKGEMLPPRIGLRILIDSLAGLHAAHEHRDEQGKPLNVVHRDFSPQNILVGTDGIARLTDFGIAKAASRASVTVAGTMKGKVSYASPEQARGGTLDRRCDVWAGGVIAWEIFAGKKLYPSSERTLLEVVKGPPPRVRTAAPNVPPEIDDIIAQALAFEVEQRTPTAKQLAKNLEDAARRHNLLAEVEEVAEYTQRMVAPVLEERKNAIAEARSRRTGVSPSQPEDLGATVPLPSLPDLPDMANETCVMEGAPVRPPASARGAAPNYNDDALVAASERARPPSFDRSNSGSTTPAGVETPQPMLPMNANPVAEMSTRARDLFARKPGLVIGAGVASIGVVLTLIVIIAVASSGPSAKELAAAASASASASALAAAPVATPPTKVTTPPPSLGDPEPLPPQLEMTANAPVRSVTVGARVVEMEVPAPNVAVELTPEEAAAAVAVSATSTDGRAAKASWNPGDSALHLAFGDAPAPAPALVPRPHGKPTSGKPAGKPGKPRHL